MKDKVVQAYSLTFYTKRMYVGLLLIYIYYRGDEQIRLGWFVIC